MHFHQFPKQNQDDADQSDLNIYCARQFLFKVNEILFEKE